MKHKTLLLSIALLAPLALKAQTSLQGTAAGQAPAPSTESAKTPNTRSLDDDPSFKSLPPEQQQWVRQMAQRLDKAMAEKDTAAIDQLAKETAEHVKGLDNPPLTYHYPNNAPPPPAKLGPCEVASKRPGLLDRIKKHAQQTIERQAAKADVKVGTATKGNVDGGVQDTTHTVITEADQSKPCPPAKIAKQ